jgi:hypothetical protein
MAERYIPVDLRRLVVARAANLCEYCLVAREDFPRSFHVDHVVAEKHGGPTAAANLAFACQRCNQIKGTDPGSIDWVRDAAGEIDWDRSLLVRFFNPRRDRWAGHFELVTTADGVPRIEPRSAVGRVTVRLFDLNSLVRLTERQALAAVGRYPSPEARARMGLA